VSCCSPFSSGSCLTTVGFVDAALDEFHCHVVSDESAEKLDQTGQHCFERLGAHHVAVRRYRFGDALYIGLRSGLQSNVIEGGMIGAPLGEGTREERVTPIAANPPRQSVVHMTARFGGSARDSFARRPIIAPTVNQALCHLYCEA